MTELEEAPARNLIDDLLREQQRMTAVERFARRHDEGELPAQSRYYRELIPATRPGPGQQYAFGVDLDACTGCKACVSACHSLNGLEDEETWRSVGSLYGSAPEKPYIQTVTTACHHCVEPACLEGCPVMAYDKDEDTGIVRHLDDQCIGCQYCMLKCPYEVPKYSEAKGIVRKCDMCSNRLARGEAPACVQACPTQAIRIEIVDRAVVKLAAFPESRLVPGAFPSDYTKPTTHYRTKRGIPDAAQPADAALVRCEHAHWPLIGMLLLSQLAVGLYAILAALALLAPSHFESLKHPLSLAGFIALNAGLGVSVLHLGRPLGAWRFFLGLRTSWMSREILAFSVLAGAATGCTAACWWESIPPLALWTWISSLCHIAAGPLAALTTALGVAAIACSAMIYIDTRRPFWAAKLTFPRFFGSALALGLAAAATLIYTGNPGASAGHVAAALTALALAVRLGLFVFEARSFLRALSDPADPIHASARTVWELLPSLALSQPGLLAISVFLGIAALRCSGDLSAVCATTAFLATAMGQIAERAVYFMAAAGPRMPGNINATRPPLGALP